MNQLYLLIRAQILSIMVDGLPVFKHVAVWNNHLEMVRQGHEIGIDFPCAFVEFTSPLNVLQLGDGSQLYDPLTVRIHIGHRQDDAGDGTFNQNLSVFDLKQKVFQAFNLFSPVGAANFIRGAEGLDYDHDNVYEFIQDYKTNYIDQLMQEPFNPSQTTVPTGLEIDIDIENSINPQPHVYDNQNP